MDVQTCYLKSSLDGVSGLSLRRDCHAAPERGRYSVQPAIQQQPADTGIWHQGPEGPPSSPVWLPLLCDSWRGVQAPSQLQLLQWGVLRELPSSGAPGALMCICVALLREGHERGSRPPELAPAATTGFAARKLGLPISAGRYCWAG